MTRSEEHVSMFELDLFFATRERNAALEAHVDECARCAGYLKELTALQEAREVPLPSAGAASRASGLPAAPTRRAAPQRASAVRSTRRLWLLSGAAAMTAAVVFSLLLLEAADERAPAVAVKGSPAVQLLVRRGQETRIWDGASRVRAGDVLGLRVACEEFSTVTVAAAKGEEWAPLEEQACPAQASARTLPFTLRVDAAPGRERFAVVFSTARLEGRALGEAVSTQRRDGSIWVTRFELEKEVTP
jgi:hypothetical protein